MAQQLNIFNSIDVLPLWNYYKCLDTDDLRYLLVLDNYFTLPEYDNDLTKIWSEINLELYEYSIKQNRRIKHAHDKNKQLQILKNQYNYTQNIIFYLSMYSDKDMEKELSLLGYKINNDKDYFEELGRIKKRSQQLIVRINLKELEIYGTKGNNEESDYLTELNAMRRHTGLEINQHKTSIKEYYNIKYGVLTEFEKKQMRNER